MVRTQGLVRTAIVLFLGLSALAPMAKAQPVDQAPIPSFVPLDGERSAWIPANLPVGEAELSRYPELVFEGNWSVEWRNNPDVLSAQLWLIRA
ncbi:MAG: hypothetical protein GY798_24725 [Hyphomicrobiales bacterium]|nr:hypothetical protein [Hyphomicrobiales bacterium]